jgi:hypothetical protein
MDSGKSCQKNRIISISKVDIFIEKDEFDRLEASWGERVPKNVFEKLCHIHIA